ncbi:acyl carrier protein [Vibrio atlanticus]|uniref:acyl carrier protein n=1 Tax=Vibrio atlanticus TaxID=693153 RepID=UPI003D147956
MHHPQVDTTLQSLWLTHTQSEQFNPDVDFINSGGNSLSMVRMLGAVCQTFNIRFSFTAFQQAPTYPVLRSLVDSALEDVPC